MAQAPNAKTKTLFDILFLAAAIATDYTAAKREPRGCIYTGNTGQVLLSTRPISEPAATALGAEASYQPKLTTVELCTSRPDKLHNWDYPKVDANKKIFKSIHG